MPLRLNISKKLSARSDRVKCVDIHPSEPWILSALYNGHVYIWNYTTQALVKTFEVTDLPVRTAKFITRKQWIVTGSDDMYIRVYNYNTMEKIKSFEGHSDYIRSVAVHPTLPYVLSSSDDMLIKLWDWDKGWANTMVFEGHTHFVMTIAINPKDTNTFATASLDRTVKVWGLGSTQPHFTLEGHDKGVNCVEYFVGGEKPYLISGADDKLVKVWDYQNKTCVQTLEGHTHNVSVVAFHPELPLIVSGSEDGTVRLWHANTYRLEKTLNYGMERVWALAYLRGSHALALGYDEGTVMLKLGKEEPVISMDQSGKLIWARHNEIFTANVRAAAESGANIPDGERLPLSTKDLGNCEVYPQSLQHSSNGRVVVVCGDGEFIIYTAIAWRNKSFGQGLDFAWSPSGNYAVREGGGKIKIFSNFKESKSFKPNGTAENLYGGNLLAVKCNSFIVFYDWEQGRVVRKIDVTPKGIYWSDQGEFLAIATENSFFILKYNKEAVDAAFESGTNIEEDGVADAFEVLHEISERVRTAHWVEDCFLYTSKANRLNYCVGGEVVTLAHLDRHMYILGYIPQTNRVYLVDKRIQVVSYTLHLSIINYQTAILRKDFETASKILPKIPDDHRNRIAQFLESQGLKEEALEVSQDPDHRFELAMQLGRLDIAQEIAKTGDSEQKWKILGDAALSVLPAQFSLAEESMLSAEDLSGLLLLYTSTGNKNGMLKLAKVAQEKGKFNIAFISYFLLHRLEDCLDLLCFSGRIPEAAFLARTYLPSHVSRIVKLWRDDLHTVNQKAAEALADPMEYSNLFPDLSLALQAEKIFGASNGKGIESAKNYVEAKGNLGRNLVDELRQMNEEEIEHLLSQNSSENDELVLVAENGDHNNNNTKNSNNNNNNNNNTTPSSSTSSTATTISPTITTPTMISSSPTPTPRSPSVRSPATGSGKTAVSEANTVPSSPSILSTPSDAPIFIPQLSEEEEEEEEA